VSPPSLAEHIGSRVRDIRLARGWTQRELAAQLETHGGKWTRAQIGLLETEGVRAERLGDLLVLCSALNVSLENLLHDRDTDVVVNGEVFSVATLAAALTGSDADPRPLRTDEIDPELIGSRDLAAEAALARRAGLSLGELEERMSELFGADASFARDAIAELSADTTRREARALRGRASRQLLAYLTANEANLEAKQKIIRLHGAMREDE
jgi:transcriptional regulator with XRE-family HTH domain